MRQNKKMNGDLYGQKYFEEHEFSYRDENREDIKRILELLKVKKSDKVLEFLSSPNNQPNFPYFGSLLGKVLIFRKIIIREKPIVNLRESYN